MTQVGDTVTFMEYNHIHKKSMITTGTVKAIKLMCVILTSSEETTVKDITTVTKVAPLRPVLKPIDTVK